MVFLMVPDASRDESISVYKKRKRSGRFRETDYYHWERPFIGNAVTYNYIHNNQSKILLNLDLTGFAELIDIKPDAGGHFIHSMSEPFSEEDLETDVMHNWLDHFGMRFHQVHASGHCQSHELRNIINTIKPRTMFPVHTERPELFKKIVRRKTEVVLPKKENPYTI